MPSEHTSRPARVFDKVVNDLQKDLLDNEVQSRGEPHRHGDCSYAPCPKIPLKKSHLLGIAPQIHPRLDPIEKVPQPLAILLRTSATCSSCMTLITSLAAFAESSAQAHVNSNTLCAHTKAPSSSFSAFLFWYMAAANASAALC
jgi:hypothetical protein